MGQNADIDRYIDVTVLVILMILIVFLQRYTKNDLIILTLITLPIIIATLNSDNNHMISMILFVIGAKYADMEKIIRMYFCVLMIAIPIVIIFCMLIQLFISCGQLLLTIYVFSFIIVRVWFGEISRTENGGHRFRSPKRTIYIIYRCGAICISLCIAFPILTNLSSPRPWKGRGLLKWQKMKKPY